ncbi:Ankyrin repeat protein [Rickettsiales bacterium Ac37b]|nr:Ankyrin repeat protein [Rickettsiales bacterium Ac37b]
MEEDRLELYAPKKQKENIWFMDKKTFFEKLKDDSLPLEELKDVLLKAPLLNAKDKEGNTPLFYAVSNNNIPMVNFFIKKGLKVNEENAKGETPIFAAFRHGHLKMAQHLLDKGADINHKNKEFGETPLFIVASKGNIKLLEYLFKNYKANPFQVDNRSRTILFQAVGSSNIEMVQNLIINYGLDINRSDNVGKVPLFIAAHSCNIKMVDFLLEQGADLHHKDQAGKTALFYVDLPKRNDDKMKILSYEEKEANTHKDVNHRVEMIMHLCEKGLSLDEEDNEGKFPLDDAQEKVQNRVYEQKHGAQPYIMVEPATTKYGGIIPVQAEEKLQKNVEELSTSLTNALKHNQSFKEYNSLLIKTLHEKDRIIENLSAAMNNAQNCQEMNKEMVKQMKEMFQEIRNEIFKDKGKLSTTFSSINMDESSSDLSDSQDKGESSKRTVSTNLSERSNDFSNSYDMSKNGDKGKLSNKDKIWDKLSASYKKNKAKDKFSSFVDEIEMKERVNNFLDSQDQTTDKGKGKLSLPAHSNNLKPDKVPNNKTKKISIFTRE